MPNPGLAQALDQVFYAMMPNGMTLGGYLASIGNNAYEQVTQAMVRYLQGDQSALNQVGAIMNNVWRTGDPPIYQQIQNDPKVQALAAAWTAENVPAQPNPAALPRTPGTTPTPASTPGLTPSSATPTAVTPDPNSVVSPGAPGAPFTLTGPGAETPFGQVASQIVGRGYLPAFNFLELMANAEHQRLADEQQRLINAATIAAQQGNMEIATQNAVAARNIAERVQALSEQTQRARDEMDRLNSATQRDVAGRTMTLNEQVTPYQAATSRMVGLAPLATSPLVNWYTARGEAPPQIISDLLANATQQPGTPLRTASNPPASTPGMIQLDPMETPGGWEGNKAFGPAKSTDMTTSAMSTGGAPFIRALSAGRQLPSFMGQVGQFAPPLPGAATWSSMTPGEKAGTMDLFSSFGTPPEDFAAMLQKSLPPGGSADTLNNAARFVGAVR